MNLTKSRLVDRLGAVDPIDIAYYRYGHGPLSDVYFAWVNVADGVAPVPVEELLIEVAA